MKKNLDIINGTLVTMDAKGTILPQHFLRVVDGKIDSIGPMEEYRKNSDHQVLDAHRCLVMPGLINGHTHLGMGLLRGVAEDLPLERWLMEVIFPAEEKHGSPEFVRMGTLLSCLEMVKSGVTCFNDMYYFEEHTAKAATDVGMRGICSQAVIEINSVPNPVEHLISGFESFLQDIKAFPLIRPAIGPHSVYGVSETIFKEVMEFSKHHNIPIHLHLSETEIEVNGCIEKYKLSPPAYCESIGLFEQKCIAAHAAVLSKEDIEILGRHQVGIVHNPESNLKLGTRIAPICELRQAGCSVGLGTDGVASNNDQDLLGELDLALKLQAHRLSPGSLRVEDGARMMTIEGAQALGLGELIGSLEIGKKADVICLDCDHPRATPLYDPYAYLGFSAHASDVLHTVIDGKVVVENREVKTVDEKAILHEARQWAEKIKPGSTAYFQ